MKPGNEINIKAQVLRVEGNRLDAQTADGQLIQTSVNNAEIKPENQTAQHKAILSAPENKASKK